MEKVLGSNCRGSTVVVTVSNVLWYDVAPCFSFGEEGEFWVSSPTPQVRLELRSISKSVLHDSRLIAKVLGQCHSSNWFLEF